MNDKITEHIAATPEKEKWISTMSVKDLVLKRDVFHVITSKLHNVQTYCYNKELFLL